MPMHVVSNMTSGSTNFGVCDVLWILCEYQRKSIRYMIQYLRRNCIMICVSLSSLIPFLEPKQLSTKQMLFSFFGFCLISRRSTASTYHFQIRTVLDRTETDTIILIFVLFWSDIRRTWLPGERILVAIWELLLPERHFALQAYSAQSVAVLYLCFCKLHVGTFFWRTFTSWVQSLQGAFACKDLELFDQTTPLFR